jgi:succinoglycan biosynthesis protein ExoA
MTADCSVLIPVYNEERHLGDSVPAICAQRFAGDLEFIFADGGSTDGTRAILESWSRRDPRIRVVDNPRRTVTSGLNVALAEATGRWVARMDAHTSYPEDYLHRGVDRLARGDTRWVSGPQLPAGRGRVSRAVGLALMTALGRSGSRKWTAADAGERDEYDLDSGVFCGVWARETLLEYGGWDERWRVNEDSELAGRFLRRGERLVCVPAMAAAYRPRDSLIALWRQYLVYGEYRALTARRHPDTLRPQHLVAPVLVAAVIVAAAGPRALRRGARVGLALYGAILGRAGLNAQPDATSTTDAMLVPVVLATMHLGWGAGTWLGWAHFGVPATGMRRLLRTAGAGLRSRRRDSGLRRERAWP